MKILFVVGSCLSVNSSANLCHIAYINGCLANGHEVDVISVDDRCFVTDNSIKLPNISNWFNYGSSVYSQIAYKIQVNNNKKQSQNGCAVQYSTKTQSSGMVSRIIRKFKDMILFSYGVYGLESAWVRKALKYKGNSEYDLVISLAYPPASHLLVKKLIDKKHIKYKHWYQIWEDPWVSDLYNVKGNIRKFEEEKKLVSYPDKVIYVSPLTLEYQKKLYPESAHKMDWCPLPYYYKNTHSNAKSNARNKTFGYYGDYHSFCRNLKPFYNAAKELDIKVNICGNSEILFESTTNINVRPRVSLSELNKIEAETDVLVFLCNLKGGQIPGKIYQYSATNKTILFILDGTNQEMSILKKYFGKFNRYVFCENNEDSIKRAVTDIVNGNIDNIDNKPIEDFSPKNIMKFMLER